MRRCLLPIILLLCALSPARGDTFRLSSLDLAPVVQGWGKPMADRSVTGTPLSINGARYEHGLGTHSPSRFSIEMGGRGRRFTARVGVDDSAEGKGSVVFRVLDEEGGLLWSSGLMRGGQASMTVDLPLEGRKFITLLVDDGGDGYEFDHADWAEGSIEMASGEPKLVAARMIDPIAELPVAGRSIDRVARPVRLPYERELPGPVTDWVLLGADGNWGKEYSLRGEPLGPAGYRYAQRRGRACNDRKAWWLLANRKTGQGVALMLAYMGNWTYEVLPRDGKVLLRLAASPADLKPFATVGGLPIPGALVADFVGHWDYGAQPIVRYARTRLLRKMGADWPPVQYNTWYADYDKIDEAGLIKSARAASEVGCELFTVDAGWYGTGGDWSASLGDWHENRAKLPNGLAAIAAEARRLGMKFGLWVEIECASPNSPLGREHPDWFLADPQGKRLTDRAVLDFGKPEVLAWAKAQIDRLMTDYRLDYLKMDFNTDPAIENEGLTQATDPLYRHYRGLARLWRYMRERYPKLIVENCASGSLREELMSLAYTDTHWVSDEVGNRPNLLFPFGATYMIPASACNHWTAFPDRNETALDLDAQFAINMMGHMGLSGKIADWDAETREAAARRIAEYKALRSLICQADVYHLTPYEPNAMQAALYVDVRSGRALLFAFQGGDTEMSRTLRLRGLDPTRRYRVTTPDGTARVLGGSELIEQGLPVAFAHAGAAQVVRLEPEKGDR